MPDEDQPLSDVKTEGTTAYEQFVKDYIAVDWAFRTGRLEEWVEEYTKKHMGERPSGDTTGPTGPG